MWRPSVSTSCIRRTNRFGTRCFFSISHLETKLNERQTALSTLFCNDKGHEDAGDRADVNKWNFGKDQVGELFLETSYSLAKVSKALMDDKKDQLRDLRFIAPSKS